MVKRNRSGTTALERKGIGSHCHELSAETFFPPFRSKSRITHNANNSEATERVRNLLEFTGFLVVQTFYSQVSYYFIQYFAVFPCFPIMGNRRASICTGYKKADTNSNRKNTRDSNHRFWLFSKFHNILRTNRTSANADQIKDRQTSIWNGTRRASAVISCFVCTVSVLVFSELAETGALALVKISFVIAAVSNFSNRLPTIVVSNVTGIRNRSAAIINRKWKQI